MADDAVAATHKTFAYLHGLPVPLDEVWSWVGDRPVDVTVIRDEKDCAAQAAKREAQLELEKRLEEVGALFGVCLLYTSPSPRDQRGSRMPSSA